MDMLRKLMIGILPFGIVAMPLVASAADEEATIEVVVEAEAEPDMIAEQLSLPETASEEAKQRSAAGLETANQARERREETGRETARGARERRQLGAGFGAGGGKPDGTPGGPDSTPPAAP
ncbi:hypothetical protein K8B33_07645 [Alcanivorax sp. JB21]|uniref:hypothetical protein n=1 Tax=Alcanivorax limicola TaxID=2874102 RepID=UPI001CC1A24B|nr:hypothetical protein [Alcanivorax limicola]MBZ2188965.1 hypothetical protein [Alcanivorax limicola]